LFTAQGSVKPRTLDQSGPSATGNAVTDQHRASMQDQSHDRSVLVASSVPCMHADQRTLQSFIQLDLSLRSKLDSQQVLDWIRRFGIGQAICMLG
jgi:hypothetical protein